MDSHAESVVAGKNVLILNDTGNTITVGPFTPELGKLNKVRIVDCAIAHDCPYTGKTHILVLYNALYVPSVDNNLVPPFVVRRRGHTINDVPKIQCSDPTEDNHCIQFEDTEIRIPLQLTGIISYFDSRAPTLDEVQEAVAKDLAIEMNTQEDTWDPHDPQFAREESLMLNYEGRMTDKQLRDRQLFHDYELESHIHDAEEIDIGAVSNTLSSNALSEAVEEVDELECFCNSGGQTLNEVFADPPDLSDDILYVGSVSQNGKQSAVTPSELSKIFRIDEKTAKTTLDVTTHHIRRSTDPTLNRRFSTNDRRLRYRNIKEFFLY